MGYTSMLRSPKKEEQQVPDTIRFSEIGKETDVADELEGFWGMEVEEDLPEGKNVCGENNWDFMDWEGFSVGEEEESHDRKVADTGMFFQEHESRFTSAKSDQKNYGFWDDDDHEEKKVSLNLSLNYQEVLDAWSDRGPLRADEYSLSMANNGYVSVLKQLICFSSFFFYLVFNLTF